MTGALIIRFDGQVDPWERRSARENSPRRTSTSLNPRERLPEVRSRGLSDVLDGYPAISRTAAPAPGAARRRDAADPVTGAPGAGCAMVVPPPRHHPGSTQSQFCRECVPRGGETGHVVEEPEAASPQGGDAQGDDGRAEGPDLADATADASAVDLGPCSSDQRPVGALTQHPSFLGSRPGTPGGSPPLWHPRTVNVHSAAGLIGDARQRGPAPGPVPPRTGSGRRGRSHRRGADRSPARTSSRARRVTRSRSPGAQSPPGSSATSIQWTRGSRRNHLI